MNEETPPKSPEQEPKRAASLPPEQSAEPEQGVGTEPDPDPEKKTDEEEREEISWPYTKGTSGLSFRFFDLVGLPEFLDEEKTEEGRLMMALISEVLHLKGSLAVLVKERQQASFEQWLSTQGKSLRNPGAPSGIMGQMKSRNKG